MTIEERILLTRQAANSFSNRRWKEIDDDESMEPYTDEDQFTLDQIFANYNTLIHELWEETRHGK